MPISPSSSSLSWYPSCPPSSMNRSPARAAAAPPVPIDAAASAAASCSSSSSSSEMSITSIAAANDDDDDDDDDDAALPCCCRFTPPAVFIFFSGEPRATAPSSSSSSSSIPYPSSGCRVRWPADARLERRSPCCWGEVASKVTTPPPPPEVDVDDAADAAGKVVVGERGERRGSLGGAALTGEGEACVRSMIMSPPSILPACDRGEGRVEGGVAWW